MALPFVVKLKERCAKENNMAKDTKESKDYQKELKDLYDTGITDKQIDDAKQNQPRDIALLGYSRYGRSNLTGPQREIGPSRLHQYGAGNTFSDLEERDKNIDKAYDQKIGPKMKKGGKVKAKPVKKMAKGGSASSRADGCCVKGKTKGRYL